MSKAVVITSGGLDSTVLCYDAAQRFDELDLLSFDYGQRHRKELQYAKKTAEALGASWRKVDLRSVTSLLSGSALTDQSVSVPEGNYAAPSMAQTVVPNRNMIMLSVAIGAAVAGGADAVVAGMHAGDHPVYPDCRPEFVRGMDSLCRVANEGFVGSTFGVAAPFVDITKAEIVRLGEDLSVPFDQTWSCYVGGKVHCGRCGTCVERAEAFFLASVDDPTVYEDKHYWKTALGYIK